MDTRPSPPQKFWIPPLIVLKIVKSEFFLGGGGPGVSLLLSRETKWDFRFRPGEGDAFTMDYEYLEAATLGRGGKNCSMIYPTCPPGQGILDRISTIYWASTIRCYRCTLYRHNIHHYSFERTLHASIFFLDPVTPRPGHGATLFPPPFYQPNLHLLLVVYVSIRDKQRVQLFSISRQLRMLGRSNFNPVLFI